MAKTKPAQNTARDPGMEALAALPFNSLVGPQAHQFWEAQERILNEVEEFTRRWFERRHTATRSAIKASEDAIGRRGATDPSGILLAVGEWQAHSVERIAEDIQEWIDLCSRCAGHLAGGEAAANKEVLEEVSKQAAGTKHEHSTPV